MLRLGRFFQVACITCTGIKTIKAIFSFFFLSFFNIALSDPYLCAMCIALSRVACVTICRVVHYDLSRGVLRFVVSHSCGLRHDLSCGVRQYFSRSMRRHSSRGVAICRVVCYDLSCGPRHDLSCGTCASRFLALCLSRFAVVCGVICRLVCCTICRGVRLDSSRGVRHAYDYSWRAS